MKHRMDEEEVENYRRKIKICDRVSIGGIVAIVLILVAEYILATFFGKASWVKTALWIMIYSFYALPFVIMVPVFFRMNMKYKLEAAGKKVKEKGRA